MKIYIIASNKYSHVCNLNVDFVNKYWPGQEICVVGYDALENYTFDSAEKVILGKQSDFDPYWSTALIPFFKSVKEEYFVVLIEDLILLNKVDVSRIDHLENAVKTGIAQKAVIGGGLPLDRTSKLSEDMLVFNQTIDYRATLHPSIWNKEYFLNFLKPNMSIWDFEIGNNSKAWNDGAVIITDNYSYPEQQHPFSNLNLYVRGNAMIDKDFNIIDTQKSARFFDKNDLIQIAEELKNA